MTFENTVILGAGAIGSVYGALLSRQIPTELVATEKHVRAIRSTGLELTGEITGEFKLNASTIKRKVSKNTLILLTTKAHESEGILKEITDFNYEGTVLLILQNGVGNEKKVREVLGSKVEILRGLTTMAAEFLSPGQIKVWKGATILANKKPSAEIAKLFENSGFNTRISENIDEDVWCKLVLNCIVNPLTAIFLVRNNEILSEPLDWIRHEMARECLSVAQAEGIKIILDNNNLDKQISKYENFSSMSQDLIKGKETEINFLNGKIVELGDKHGIPTPVNKTVTKIVKFLEGRKSGL